MSAWLQSEILNSLALHWEGTEKAFMSEFIRSHGIFNCEKYTKNIFRNYEIYKNMKKHIDKLFLQDNNVITLIKHFIKDKIK